jgi:hypothetical protein
MSVWVEAETIRVSSVVASPFVPATLSCGLAVEIVRLFYVLVTKPIRYLNTTSNEQLCVKLVAVLSHSVLAYLYFS